MHLNYHLKSQYLLHLGTPTNIRSWEVKAYVLKTFAAQHLAALLKRCSINMANKPEATYRNSVHKHLDKSRVYYASIGSSYVAGVPDMYYEGSNGALWIEWKNFQKLPRLIQLTNPSSRSKLSPLQQQWLRRGNNNGQHTAVICGSPLGGVIYDGLEWEVALNQAQFILRSMDRKEVAQWITKQVSKK